MTDTKDIAAIAAGLTRWQAECCRNLTGQWGAAPSVGPGRPGHACCISMSREGLVEVASSSIRIADVPAYRLTPLGLSVKAHLTAGATHDR